MRWLRLPYLVLHGRLRISPTGGSAWSVAGFGFLGVYLLPFVKYPANPPAIGDDFTIQTRGRAVPDDGCAAPPVGFGACRSLRRASCRASSAGRRPSPPPRSASSSCTAAWWRRLPSLGDLSANVEHADEFGFARAATETPQPITNNLSTPLTIETKDAGKSVVQPGQILYPGSEC